MERISSPANDSLKLLRQLERKKTRAETGLFIAEGERLVREAFDNGWQAEILAFSEQALTDADTNARLMALSGRARRDIILPPRLVEKVSTKPNAGRVLGAFKQKALTLPPEIGDGRWIALHKVRDPSNLGTILRTADCAGASGVIMLDACCDPYSIETVRASMGSIFALPPIITDFETFNAWRIASGLSLLGASMHGKSRPDQVALNGAHCWLMGNEQSGLPQLIETACDDLVRIPMRQGADSLNLAQATTLLTYETWRQRGFTES